MPRLREYNLHLPQFHFDRSRSLTILYVVRVLKDFVNKLAVFFLPIYLYEVATRDPFWQILPGENLQRGVVLIGLFYLVHRVTVFVAGVPVGKMISKWGYDRILSFALLFSALFVALLYRSSEPGWTILLAAMVNGFGTILFWPGYFTLVSRFAQHQRIGQDLGLVQIFVQIVSAIAPALGGLLIVFAGYSSLMIFSLIFLLMAAVIVLKVDVNRENDQISWREFVDWLSEKSFVRLATAYAGRYINDATLLLWPLFVFLILGSVDKVGLLYTFSLFLALIVSLLVGFYVDHNKSKKPFYASGGILTVLWLVRTQIWSFWQIMIVDSIDRLTSNFHWLFFDAKILRRSQGNQALSFFIYREMIFSVFAIIFWLAVIAIFSFTVNPWQGLFLLAAVGVLLSLRIREHHSDG